MPHDCEPLNKALDQHVWIQTLPHDQILKQMRNHDVLLFLLCLMDLV